MNAMCLLTSIVEAIAVSDTLRGPTVNIEKSSQERLSVRLASIRESASNLVFPLWEHLSGRSKFFCEIHFTVLLVCAHSLRQMLDSAPFLTV